MTSKCACEKSMRLEVNPQFSRLSLKAKTPLAYALWSLLRPFVNSNHSGVFDKSQVYAIARQMKFSDRHIRRIMARGNGVYWGLDNKHLFIRKPDRVRLALQRLTGDTMTPNECYVDNLSVDLPDTQSKTIKAYLYYSFFWARGEITISRDSIHDETGLSHDQQRAYESALGDALIVRTNYAHIYHDDLQDKPRPLPEHHYSIGYNMQDMDGDTYPVIAYQYQLPNTYIASVHNAPHVRTTRTPVVMRRSVLAHRWHTNSSYLSKMRYCRQPQQLSKDNAESQYLRVYFQGKKRLWACGQDY